FGGCGVRAYAQMGTDRATADAVYLLRRIVGLGADEVSERDMQSVVRSRFKTKADLLPALGRLVDHGYLLPLPAGKPTGGRPAAPPSPGHPYCPKDTKDTERNR